MKKLEQDTMPVEVATAMLTEPKARLTNRMRKNCMAARQTVYISDTPRKPIEVKLAARMKSKPITSLVQDAKRLGKKRRGLQRKYELVKKLPTNPVIERLLAALDIQAAHIDLVLDAAEQEILARKRK